jgi:hypothetical protein
MAELAEACAGQTVKEKRRRCVGLLEDQEKLSEAVADYRLWLATRGISKERLWGMGAAESQRDAFADRAKHHGRSWSCEG